MLKIQCVGPNDYNSVKYAYLCQMKQICLLLEQDTCSSAYLMNELIIVFICWSHI